MPQIDTIEDLIDVAQPWDPTIPFEPKEDSILDRNEQMVSYLIPLLRLARDTARAAYMMKLGEIGDAGACGFVSISIETSGASKQIVRALAAGASMGRFNQWDIDYEITPGDFLQRTDDMVQSMEVQEAGCEAFAAVLRQNGFACRVRSRVD